MFYTWGEQAKARLFDPGFGKAREWDVPLLDGYEYEFIANISSSPGSHHFKGIINPDLINKIESFQANAILVFGWAFQSHLKIMRYFKRKIPVFFRGDSTLLDEPQGVSIKKLMRRIFLKWVYRHIDYALYVGTNNRDYYIAHGVSSSRLIYAPHAIDNSRFSKGSLQYEQEAAQWRASLGIAPDKPVVLFAGKLEPKKNPMFLVEAAKEIPGMHFIIVGNGVIEKNIKQESQKLDNVSLLPFQNQSKMPVVYRLADIFVLPSSGPGETWGLAINEAMACGRIVIASKKCGGAIDLIKEGKNGFIIDPDVHSLIKALNFINSDKSHFSNYKNQSVKLIESFSYEKIASTIEASIAQISNEA